jgi:hypothetical protein
LDPLALAAKSVMDGVLRKEIKGIVQNELSVIAPENVTVMKDYLLEASFIPYFNNVMLRNMVRETAQDTLETVIIGEILEDWVEVETQELTY